MQKDAAIALAHNLAQAFAEATTSTTYPFVVVNSQESDADPVWFVVPESTAAQVAEGGFDDFDPSRYSFTTIVESHTKPGVWLVQEHARGGGTVVYLDPLGETAFELM
jgi:hypothetical protein